MEQNGAINMKNAKTFYSAKKIKDVPAYFYQEADEEYVGPKKIRLTIDDYKRSA
jgi:hypothetical protein